MHKQLLTLLLFLFTQNVYSQVLPTMTPVNSTDSAGLKKAKSKPVKSTPSDNNTQTIKFISDEECNILIDAENRGHLKPNALLKINLRKGQYLLEVVGVNRADKINETLVVDETGTERLYPISLKAVTDTRVEKQAEVQRTAEQAELQRKAGQAELQREAEAKHLNLVLVQGGTFSMGSDGGESNEKPIHTVTVNGFYMSRYMVTQAQWRIVMGNNPSSTQCDDCPVDNITWDDAQAYCQKLSQLNGKTYRLPTEAEWEYAARGGIKGKGYTYSGSNSIEEVGWYGGNSDNSIHPVGEKQPNELGLYDLTGNVNEWCSDWYDQNYYGSSPAQNPRGASTGSFRVIRGGGWLSPSGSCRATCRIVCAPDSHFGGLGFRPVVSF
jgi:sulfatase modifying factor 1